MKIFLVIKCATADAYNFISQLTGIEQVEQVTVFRDAPSLPDGKVEYIVPGFAKWKFLKLGIRLLQIVKRKKRKPGLVIGIYEWPHGLLAMLAGKIMRTPSAVSIIGNPAYAKLRKGLRLRLTMWILRKCDFVTVTGTNSKKFLVEKGFRAEKIFVLPNTIDFTPFGALGLEKEYDVISLGRISEEKHVEVFVELVALLRNKMPDIKAAIGGSGPKKEKIVRLVEKLGLKSKIDIAGFVPEDQLSRFFNRGKVFILTSETEGFPRTIIQAAACGVPVVASGVGDVPDVIDHERNGFLVSDCGNVEEYSQRVLQLLNDTDLYGRFSVALNKKVRERFKTENASIVWREIFEKIGSK